MVTTKINELRALEAKAAELRRTIETERAKELAALPEQYGFSSPDEFYDAMEEALRSVGRGRGRGRKTQGRAVKAAKSSGPKKRTRAKITEEMKMKVGALVQAGKTGAEVAKEIGISVPSVQNIKKELGLVAPRS
jgi:DNA-binding NarL/FixJ family response regulator